MEKIRAERNRTITLTDDNRRQLSQHLSSLDHPATAAEICDRIINQDLFTAIDFLPRRFADLIVIDPPYNLFKDFAGMRFMARNEAEYAEYVRSWLPRVMELLKPGGSVYVCSDWRSSGPISQVLSEHAEILNRITWQREKGRGAMRNWKNAMEDIWFAVADPKNYFFDVNAVKQRRRVIAPYRDADGKPKDWMETADGNFRDSFPSNFWDDITIPYWSMPENTDHPTQKPEKLIAKLILASCPEGGFVFDPFLGSGTTAVVAQKLGRHFCGVEISREYALLAAKRLALAADDPIIQGYSQGVFWPRNSLPTSRQAQGKK